MIALLQTIVCVLLQIPYFALWAGIMTFNAVIAAIGAIIVPLVALMPEIPDLDMPSQIVTVLGWINWIFPVSTVIDIVVFAVLVYVTWFLIVLMLRWAKATDQ